VMESSRTEGGRRAAIVHTGWWGCGAFGGNHTLMAVLQAVAAQMAGVEQLVFHSGPPADEARFKAAVKVLEDLGGDLETAALIDRLVAMRWPWGESNGT
jgi:Poly (ADP-ribose) glycohydrolase (PARG)